MIEQLNILKKTLELSSKTKLYAFLALIIGLSAACLDIILAILLADTNINQSYIIPIIVIIIRSIIALLCNGLILKFSVACELDLKVKSLELPESERDNFYKLISFNTSHMALTILLRIAIEFIMMMVIIVYISLIDIKLIISAAIFVILFSIIFWALFKYSANLRANAAEAQAVFLTKGSRLVALSDRAKQLETMSFFQEKLRFYSLNYESLSVKSLFIAQSFKPILEPMVFLIGLYLITNFSVAGALLYLLYRIAGSLIVFVNGLPVMDHYMKQYKNSIKFKE